MKLSVFLCLILFSISALAKQDDAIEKRMQLRAFKKCMERNLCFHNVQGFKAHFNEVGTACRKRHPISSEIKMYSESEFNVYAIGEDVQLIKCNDMMVKNRDPEICSDIYSGNAAPLNNLSSFLNNVVEVKAGSVNENFSKDDCKFGQELKNGTCVNKCKGGEVWIREGSEASCKSCLDLDSTGNYSYSDSENPSQCVNGDGCRYGFELGEDRKWNSKLRLHLPLIDCVVSKRFYKSLRSINHPSTPKPSSAGSKRETAEDAAFRHWKLKLVREQRDRERGTVRTRN